MKSILKKWIILTVSFQLKTYHLTSSCTVLNAMMRCMFTDNYDSSFCFWVFKKRLTQEKCFLICKKYGLLNGFIFFNNQEIFTVLFYKLSWSVFRGNKILVFHTWSRVVSAMERVRSKNIYTNNLTRNELWNFRLMVLKTLVLITGFYCI